MPFKVDPIERTQAAGRDAVAARATTTTLPALSGFEDQPIRDLVLARRHLKQAKSVSLRPLLPLLLQLKGQPYSLHDYFPFEPLFRLFVPKTLLLKTGRQVAKSRPLLSEERVYAENGRPLKPQELISGTRVLALDSSLRWTVHTVVGRHQNPPEATVRVTTQMGSVFGLSERHELRTLHGYTPVTELVAGSRVATLRLGGRFMSAPVCYNRIVATAYLIGNGCCGTGNCIELTNASQYTVKEFAQSVDRDNPKTVWESGRRLWRCRVSGERSIVAGWLREDQLLGKYAWEKHLPAWVFDLSEDDTILFLSRLWATDGLIKRRKTGLDISYSTTSYDLSRDVRALLTKLGIPVSVKRRKAGGTKNGVCMRCHDVYTLRVETRDGWRRFLDTIIVPGKPAVAPREAAANSNRDTVPIAVAGLRHKPKCALRRAKATAYLRYFERVAPDHPRLQQLRNVGDGDVLWDEIVSIEPIGVQPTWDIEVDGEHNYVLDGVVSHNSTSAAARGIVFSNSVPHFSTLYVTPLFEMVRRFSHNYVQQFLATSPVSRLFMGSKNLKSVLQRTFRNGSSMFFSYAFLDAERTRGVPADCVTIDEVQDMNSDFLPIIYETLSGSDWGLKQSFGTPKSLDNTIQALWEDSSQAEWMIPCLRGGCNHWNVPAAEHDLFDMIGPVRDDISEEEPGLVCAKCRKPLRPREGRWMHAVAEKRAEFAGYHIPQIIMPMHYRNPEKWGELVGKMRGRGNTTPTVFLNEVCGESCDTGSKLVTATDLKEAACLPWPCKAGTACKHNKAYLSRVLAVDWGGGGGRLSNSRRLGEQQRLRTSFTSLAAMGMRPDGKVDVMWGHRSLRTHDWEYEARLCLEAVTMFRCSHIVHDFSNAGEGRLILLLQAGFPQTNVLNFRYHSFGHNRINFHPPNDDNPYAWYSLDRSQSLVTVCQCIKYGLIRFFQYDHVSNDAPGLLHDFLSLIEEKVDSATGTDVYKITRNPNKPDDFAHAVNIGAAALWELNRRWPNIAAAVKFRMPPEVLRHVHPAAKVDWDDI